MAQIIRRTDKHGRPRYTARIRLTGQQTTKTFPNRKDAEAWIRRTEADIVAGRYRKTGGKQLTTADVIDRFLADDVAGYADERTMRQRLAWWRQEIGSVPIRRLSRSQVAEGRDKLSRRVNGRTGGALSASTVRGYIAAISAVLTRAVRDYELIDDNPARQVTRPKQKRAAPQFIEKKEDIEALIEAAGSDQDPMALPLILTALSTGMRKGELVRLRWPDVDLRAGLLSIAKTKNNQPRTVRLVGAALESLRDWCKVRRLVDDRVFPPTAKGADGTSRINRIWTRLRKTTSGTDMKFHGTRHTAGTWLSQAGAHPVDIARVLGQKSLAMALVYQHLTEQRRDEIAAKLDTAMFGEADSQGG